MKSEWRRSFKWCRNMFKTLRFTQLDLTLWDFARCFWHPVLVDLIPSGLHRMKKARAENHIAALHNAQSAARRAWQILTGPFVVHEAKAHGARIFQQNLWDFNVCLIFCCCDFGVWTADQMPLFSESINYILKHLDVFVFWWTAFWGQIFVNFTPLAAWSVREFVSPSYDASDMQWSVQPVPWSVEFFWISRVCKPLRSAQDFGIVYTCDVKLGGSAWDEDCCIAVWPLCCTFCEMS